MAGRPGGGGAVPHPLTASLQPTAGPPCFSSLRWPPPSMCGAPSAPVWLNSTLWIPLLSVLLLQPSFALTRVAQIAFRGTDLGKGVSALGRESKGFRRTVLCKGGGRLMVGTFPGLLDTLSCGEGTARAAHSKVLLLPDPEATPQVRCTYSNNSTYNFWGFTTLSQLSHRFQIRNFFLILLISNSKSHLYCSS